MNEFLFGVYPYIALTIFLLGSLLRFDRDQYTWKADSSQLLKRGQLRMGSILFHAGVLLLFFGHLFGLLTPHAVYSAFGLSVPTKQLIAVVAGGIFGLMCLLGISLLIHRRLSEPRILATSSKMDIAILFWVALTLVIGLISTLFSLAHKEGEIMLLLAEWAQHIVTFRGGAAEAMLNVPFIYKLHVVCGLTLFVMFPFSRLVHVWSGFGIVGYLFRPYQLVRQRKPMIIK